MISGNWNSFAASFFNLLSTPSHADGIHFHVLPALLIMPLCVHPGIGGILQLRRRRLDLGDGIGFSLPTPGSTNFGPGHVGFGAVFTARQKFQDAGLVSNGMASSISGALRLAPTIVNQKLRSKVPRIAVRADSLHNATSACPSGCSGRGRCDQLLRRCVPLSLELSFAPNEAGCHSSARCRLDTGP